MHLTRLTHSKVLLDPIAADDAYQAEMKKAEAEQKQAEAEQKQAGAASEPAA